MLILASNVLVIANHMFSSALDALLLILLGQDFHSHSREALHEVLANAGEDVDHIPYYSFDIWVFPKIGVPQNGWLIMENPIKMG